MTDAQRYGKARAVSVLSLWVNIVLTAFKLVAGVLGRSRAMVADAVHSLSDLVTTGIVLFGIRVARQPEDKEHPYGHGRAEPLAAAAVGLILAGAGAAIIHSAWRAMATRTVSVPSLLALAAAVISILTKELLFRAAYAVGKQTNNTAVIASAWHHRSDALSSVASLAGIGGSIIGARLGIPGLALLDPLAGIAVAAFILKIAADIVVLGVRGLMDTSPGEEVLQRIRQVALTVKGVRHVDSVKARYVGSYLHIDMKIEVDPAVTVTEGHAVAHSVQVVLLEQLEHVAGVMIHVNPHITQEA